MDRQPHRTQLMSDLPEKIVGNPIRQLAVALDGEIKAVLDSFWGTWTMDDIKARCVLVSYHGGKHQTLYADSTPLLEIYPFETVHELLDDRYVVRITQKYRRLVNGGESQNG